jgi:hypothetical protein
VKLLVKPFVLHALRKVAPYEMLHAMHEYLLDIYQRLSAVKKKLPLNY